MNTTPIEFLKSLVSDIPVLSEKLHECFQKWKPDTFPIIGAFSEVGSEIGDRLDEFPDGIRVMLFQKIEEGMISNDIDLRTAMATGLIEALVTSADQVPELWGKLEKLFGIASKRHAQAWRDFGATKSEGMKE